MCEVIFRAKRRLFTAHFTARGRAVTVAVDVVVALLQPCRARASTRPRRSRRRSRAVATELARGGGEAGEEEGGRAARAGGDHPLELVDDDERDPLAVAAAARARGPPSDGAVLYLGHIPHGFYEEQMRGFFGQPRREVSAAAALAQQEDGPVEALRVRRVQARRGRAGRRQVDERLPALHQDPRVPRRAAGGRPPGDVQVGGPPFKQVDWTARERKRHNAARSPAEAQAREERLVRKEQQLRRKLADAGIDEFGGFAAQAARPAKRRAACAAPRRRAPDARRAGGEEAEARAQAGGATKSGSPR